VSGGEPKGCVFCDAQTGEQAESLVLWGGVTCYVILNLYPYNNGHLMVVPRRHIASLAEATREELDELIGLTRASEMALTEAYHPQGLNMGVNLGRAAGAGVVDHVHIHVLPRWTGDTSFMSVVGGVRVVPEDLKHTGARLRPIFDRLMTAEQQG
jgi:ATP adenylyltransferase